MSILSKTSNSERKYDSTKIAHDLTTSLTRDKLSIFIFLTFKLISKYIE